MLCYTSNRHNVILYINIFIIIYLYNYIYGDTIQSFYTCEVFSTKQDMRSFLVNNYVNLFILFCINTSAGVCKTQFFFTFNIT